jgi:hypothetical protein
MLDNNVKLNGIYTYYESSFLMTAYLAQKLNLPCVPFETAIGISSLEEFLKSIDRFGIHFPQKTTLKYTQIYQHINLIENFNRSVCTIKNESERKKIKDQILHKITSIKPPFLMKHLSDSIHKFVRECETLEDYHKNLLESVKFFPEMDIHLETNFEGLEISISVLVQNNDAVFISISEIFSDDQNLLFKIISMTPSLKLSADEINLIEMFFSKLVSDLNIQNACLRFKALCKPKSMFPLRSKNNLILPIQVKSVMCNFATVYTSVCTSYEVNLLLESFKIHLGIPLQRELLKFKQKNPIYLTILHIRPEKVPNLCNCVMIKLKLTKEELRDKRENITSLGVMAWMRRKRRSDIY